MSIVCLAPPETFAALQAALKRWLPPGREPRAVTTGEALRHLASAEHGCFVLDPSRLRAAEFEAVKNAIAPTRLDVIVYTSWGRLSRAMQVAAPFPIELVIVGAECENEILGALCGAAEHTVAAMVRFEIGPNVSRLRVALQLNVHGLFGWARLPTSAKSFAAKIGRSLTTVNRWLADEGLATVSVLVAGANVARMHHWLTYRPDADDADGGDDGVDTVDAIANRHSRTDAHNLRVQFGKFVSLAPRRAGRELAPSEVADRIVSRLLTGSRQSGGELA